MIHLSTYPTRPPAHLSIMHGCCQHQVESTLAAPVSLPPLVALEIKLTHCHAHVMVSGLTKALQDREREKGMRCLQGSRWSISGITRLADAQSETLSFSYLFLSRSAPAHHFATTSAAAPHAYTHATRSPTTLFCHRADKLRLAVKSRTAGMQYPVRGPRGTGGEKGGNVTWPCLNDKILYPIMLEYQDFSPV